MCQTQKSERVVIRADGPVKKRGSRAGKQLTYAQQVDEAASDFGDNIASFVEYLIAHGHQELGVWGYTLRKVIAMVELSERRSKEELKAQALVARASQASAEGFEGFMKLLGDSNE